jgi:hypothetical protein
MKMYFFTDDKQACSQTTYVTMKIAALCNATLNENANMYLRNIAPSLRLLTISAKEINGPRYISSEHDIFPSIFKI